MITRVLVANRGEIARRVIATCHRMGLGTVAVCSGPDLDAPHAGEADVAVRLPGAAAADTYLRADLLVAAALRAGADAVHPGYGFLAENAAFARAVLDAGLAWIGPSPEVIATMGGKIESKRLAAAAGVPVLDSLDPYAVRAEDLPVLVKASAGGGGRGMRVVRSLDDLPGALSAARGEAAAAFGDPAVFVEPYLESGHHVEVQIVADEHGTILTLGERECSVQRRHQKVIEESPSPLVSRIEGMRERLCAAAAAIAKAVGYTGAGTVEFLAAPDGRFWFLEMNTRIQVEHPVTECVTGVDLVEWQVVVASGGRLPSCAPAPRGFAVEARLYAEDPALDWRPATGTLHLLDVTATHPAFTAPVLDVTPRGVRVDACVTDGAVIGVHYDPMLAKIIAWAPARDEAIARLARTLTTARVHGVRTNRDLLARVLRHPEFVAGEATTRFLDQHDLTAPLLSPAEEDLAATAAALAGAAWRRETAAVLGGLPSGWRNVPGDPQWTVLTGPGADHRVTYRFGRDGVVVPGAHVLEVGPHCVLLEDAGVVRRFRVARYPGDVRRYVDGEAGGVVFTEAERFPAPRPAADPGSLLAPLPGTVVAVHVTEGDKVEAGQELLVIEAMKMRHTVRADRAGQVTSVAVTPGGTVEVGTVLAVLS